MVLALQQDLAEALEEIRELVLGEVWLEALAPAGGQIWVEEEVEETRP